MTTDVGICNLALGHLGESAIVTTLTPPSGSVHAGRCALFYPMARDAVLNMYPWQFAVKRIALAALTNPPSSWLYVYAQPDDCLTPLAVMEPTAPDDYSYSYSSVSPSDLNYLAHQPLLGGGVYTPQAFTCETLANNAQVIYTNVPNAVLRYTARQEDATTYSALAVVAISTMLAGMLAGPIVKGAEGRAVGAKLMQEAQFWVTKAELSDAAQRKIEPAVQPAHLNARA